MSRIKLPGWKGPVLNAAIWLREYKNIPEYENIDSTFAKYFNCSIITEADPDYLSKGIVYVYAEFDEKDALFFALRWS